MWRSEDGCAARPDLNYSLSLKLQQNQYLDRIMGIYARNVQTMSRVGIHYLRVLPKTQKRDATRPQNLFSLPNLPGGQSPVQAMTGEGRASKIISLVSCKLRSVTDKTRINKY